MANGRPVSVYLYCNCDTLVPTAVDAARGSTEPRYRTKAAQKALLHLPAITMVCSAFSTNARARARVTGNKQSTPMITLNGHDALGRTHMDFILHGRTTHTQTTSAAAHGLLYAKVNRRHTSQEALGETLTARFTSVGRGKPMEAKGKFQMASIGSYFWIPRPAASSVVSEGNTCE
ncbi:unnamed protein product [Ectocarpus sp. 4 AP-2014]